jgi:prepilin-type N-terminal cleavage/methylation domain-containing protein
MRTRRNAFTLVEILVVMSIIALLAALLLSAIVFIRARARLTECNSNVRELVKGAISWASRNKQTSRLPHGPPNRFPLDFTTAMGAASPGIATDEGAFGPSCLFDGRSPIQYRVRGLGFLHSERDVNNENVFYCPDQAGEFYLNNDRSGFRTTAGAARFDVSAATSTAVVRSSYAYRTSLNDDNNPLRSRPPDAQRENKEPILADAFCLPDTGFPDGRLAHGNTKYSVGFADGSVRVFDDPNKLLETGNFAQPTSATAYGVFEGVNGPWQIIKRGI